MDSTEYLDIDSSISGMTVSELRQIVLACLQEANVLGLDSRTIKESFVRGTHDISFDDLELDSLAAMQFCIEIELRLGLSIAPRELARIRTLNVLVETLLSRRR